MALKPVGFRLLILPDKDPVEDELGEKTEGGYTTKGGIFIAEESETVKEIHRELAAQDFGTVISIGDMCWKDYGDGTPWASVGDRVSFAKYSGKFVKDPDTEEELVLLNDNDVIAVITEETQNA